MTSSASGSAEDYFVRTQQIFAPLQIRRPQLTDALLQRPPFRFLHDVVRSTLDACPGFLEGLFSVAELDPGEAGASRDSKIAFLEKLIDALNADGALDGIRPAKIVAGKDPAETNLLLQYLAQEAIAHIAAVSKKAKKEKKEKDHKKSSSSSSKNLSTKKSTADASSSSNKEREKAEKAASSSSTALKKHSSSTSKIKEQPSSSSKSKDKEKEAKTSTKSSLPTSKNLLPSSSTKSKSDDKERVKDGEKPHRSSREKAPTEDSTTKKRSKKITDEAEANEQKTLKRTSSKTGTSKIAQKEEEKSKERRRKHRTVEETSAISVPTTVNSPIPRGTQKVTTMIDGAGIDTQILQPTTTHTGRESSGGTSKGGDDSGIAEETSAESGRHDSAGGAGFRRHHLTSSTRAVRGSAYPSRRSFQASDGDMGVAPPDFLEIDQSAADPSAGFTGIADGQSQMFSEDQHSPRGAPPPPMTRPQTAAGRPQTAIGRPGTAMARPAPPRLKKSVLETKTGGDDGTKDSHLVPPIELSSVPAPTTQMATLSDLDQFIVEEDDESLLGGSSRGLTGGAGANIQALREGADHGVLVNRIIENTREQLAEDEAALTSAREASGSARGGPSGFFDAHEQRRVRADVETVQRAIQLAMQNVQPLARVIESAALDFDSILKEVQDTNRAAADAQRRLEERQATVAPDTDALVLQLRALDQEIAEVRAQIAQTQARIWRNERRLEAQLASALFDENDANASSVPPPSSETEHPNLLSSTASSSSAAHSSSFISTALPLSTSSSQQSQLLLPSGVPRLGDPTASPRAAKHRHLWTHIVQNFENNDLALIIKGLIHEHREAGGADTGVVEAGRLRPHFSIYRDILFVALDRYHRSLDREQFELQYAEELDKLPPAIRARLQPQDQQPKPLTIACRRIFLPLDII